MPYKDKKKQKEAIQKAVEKHRKGITPGITVEGITSQSVTSDVIPAIVKALVDPVRRKKLEDITLSLKKHGVAKEVRYGIHGPTFDMVGDLLDVTD